MMRSDEADEAMLAQIEQILGLDRKTVVPGGAERAEERNVGFIECFAAEEL